MYHVYLIQSTKNKSKKYVGFTTNLKQRLETHNSGGSVYTKLDRPWELVMFLTFMDEKKALAFEKYLKNHAGRAFAQKRFW